MKRIKNTIYQSHQQWPQITSMFSEIIDIFEWSRNLSSNAHIIITQLILFFGVNIHSIQKLGIQKLAFYVDVYGTTDIVEGHTA